MDKPGATIRVRRVRLSIIPIDTKAPPLAFTRKHTGKKIAARVAPTRNWILLAYLINTRAKIALDSVRSLSLRKRGHRYSVAALIYRGYFHEFNYLV